MNLEEYKERMKAEDWAPGWEAIDDSMASLYGDQEPEHYGTLITARAMLGGNAYIDGYSIYHSNKQTNHLHIVTYGMSELYSNVEAFGGEFSGWGYEMTMRLVHHEGEDGKWALDMLGNLARYTNANERAWFEANQFVVGDGSPIQSGSDSKITSLIIVEDPELPAIETVHGQVEFLQMVGVTWDEMNAIRHNRDNLQIIIENMKKENPLLITDMKRTKNYLDGTILP